MADKTYRIAVTCEQTGEVLLERNKLTQAQADKLVGLAPQLDTLIAPSKAGAFSAFGFGGKRPA